MGARHTRALTRPLAAAALGLALTACTPLVVGGAATGVGIANGHRSAAAVVDDTLIKFRAEALISARRNLHRDTHVDVTSVNGLVLLTGEVGNAQNQARVLRLVRSLHGVRRIVDQLRLAPPSSFASRLADSWITLRVKSALVADGLDATHIKVVTAHRVVYLLGIVPKALGDKAALAASVIPHVRSIVELFQYQP